MKNIFTYKTIISALILTCVMSATSFATSLGTVYTDPNDTTKCAATVYGWVSAPADSWIEANLGNGTQQFARAIHSGEFSATLTNLVPNATYSYRMAAINPNTGGRFEGNIQTLTTRGCGSTPTVDTTVPTVSISASPNPVTVGSQTTISWYSSNATSCINTFGSSSNATSGSFTRSFSTAGTNTYSITCVRDSNGRSASASVSIVVQDTTQYNPTVSLYVNPSSVGINESASLVWNSSNANYCIASGINWNGSKSTSGTESISYPSSGTRDFTITCYGSTGAFSTARASLVVNDTQTSVIPTVSIYASPSTITYGSNTTLIWNSSNASYCTANNSWSGSKSTSGTEVRYGLSQGTYTFGIMCYGYNGQASSAQTTVYVNNTNTGNGFRPDVSTSGATNISTTGATLAGYVNTNGSSDTVRYFEYGQNGNFTSTTNSYSQGYNSGSYSDGVYNLSCNTTYNYRAVARNNYGTSYGQMVSFTTYACGGGNTTNNSNLSAMSTSATNIGYSSARINGIVVTSISPTNIYFEYGATPSLGNRTTARSISTYSSTNVYDILTGLDQGVTYYYRLVAENSNGTSRGDIVAFKTEVFSGSGTTTGGTTTTTTTKKVVDYKSCGNGVYVLVGKTCPVQGVINTTQQATGVINVNTTSGEAIPALANVAVEKLSTSNDNCDYVYKITYTNTSDKNLSNVLVKVSIPQELAFVSSTAGVFRDTDNTLTLSVGDIAAKGSGSFTVNTRINEGAQMNKTVSVSAYLSYTDVSSGGTTQNEVSGYTLLTIASTCSAVATVQGGAAGFSGFLPTNLVQWIVLAAAILVIVVAARILFKKAE